MPTVKLSINNEFSKLDIFLKKHKAVSGGNFTHTSISKGGSYYIENSELDEFFEKYYEHIFIKKLPCHLTEGIRDCEVTPVKIDLDFRKYVNTNKDVPDRIYKMEDIIKICQKYMEAMEEWLVTPDNVERHCYILEKPSPSFDLHRNGEIKKNDKGEKRVKDGVHIMFPQICTKTYLQLEFRKIVLKNLGDLLDKYNYDEKNSEIFDRAVIDRNNWQMYGSNKGKEFLTYKVTKILEIYKDSYKHLDLDKYEPQSLIKLLSVRNKTEASLVKYEKQLKLEENEESQKQLEKQKKKYNSKGKTSKRNKIPLDEIRLIIGWTPPNTDEYKPGYMDCLSIDRAKNFETWMEVGWALHNIDNTNGVSHSNNPYPGLCWLLGKWINWSRQEGTGYENEPIETYIDAWEKMRTEGGVAFGSLKLWAKEDAKKTLDKKVEEGSANKDQLTLYEKIVKNDLHGYLMKATGKNGGLPYDVAKVMLQMYKDVYVCVSIKDCLWFYYDEDLHKWIEDDKGIRLKMKISTEVWDKFHKLQKEFDSKVTESGDENEIKRDNVRATTSKLKQTPFKANVMIECMALFYDVSRNFYDKLDSNINLIGFNNGVYDLEQDDFRKGRPEDYITMSTNIDFITYDPNSIEMKGIHKFINEILTIKSVREYVIKLMASFICGSTRSEKFHVWSGSGGNGKSKLIELLEKCLGDYAGKMNVSNLTQKRGSAGQANPELARTKGKRFINMQEPDEQCKLNVGLMKEMTGGDRIIARALFKEPIEFKPQFTMVLTCNDKPELPPDDDGTWRRIVLVEYRSKFRHDPVGTWMDSNDQPITTHNHKLNIENNISTDYWCPLSDQNPQFPIDETVNEKFESWKEPFISYLIEIYKKNKDIDLREPDEVKEYTKKYREANQHFKDFINDKIVFDMNCNTRVRLECMYSEYRIWYRDNNGGSVGQKKQKDFKIFMDKEYIDYWDDEISCYGKGYRAYIIISTNTQQNNNKDVSSEELQFIDDNENEEVIKKFKYNDEENCNKDELDL